MADEYITRSEHEEFAKRIDEQDKRQNKRIDELEESVKDINRLATSIEKICVNQDYMIDEQKKQRQILEKQADKIEKIENAPLETVNSAKKKIVETAITVVITALVIGLMAIIAQQI